MSPLVLTLLAVLVALGALDAHAVTLRGSEHRAAAASHRYELGFPAETVREFLQSLHEAPADSDLEGGNVRAAQVLQSALKELVRS